MCVTTTYREELNKMDLTYVFCGPNQEHRNYLCFVAVPIKSKAPARLTPR